MTVTSNVTWIWTNLLLVLLGLVFIAALVYFKSSCIFYRKLYGSSEITAEQHTPIPLHHSPIVNTRVLLVYDTNDDSIQKKASILRQQLICSGVSIVIYFPSNFIFNRVNLISNSRSMMLATQNNKKMSSSGEKSTGLAATSTIPKSGSL